MAGINDIFLIVEYLIEKLSLTNDFVFYMHVEVVE